MFIGFSVLLHNFQKRDLIVSQVLIIIVLLFLLCHSLKIVLNLYELSLTCQGKWKIQRWIKWIWRTNGPICGVGEELADSLHRSEVFRLMSLFSNILIVFNSSVNFIIYFAKDPKWGTAFLRILILIHSFRFYQISLVALTCGIREVLTLPPPHSDPPNPHPPFPMMHIDRWLKVWIYLSTRVSLSYICERFSF